MLFPIFALIALAIGFRIYADSTREKENITRILGVSIGIFIMIMSVLGLACCAAKCMKGSCPVKQGASMKQCAMKMKDCGTAANAGCAMGGHSAMAGCPITAMAAQNCAMHLMAAKAQCPCCGMMMSKSGGQCPMTGAAATEKAAA